MIASGKTYVFLSPGFYWSLDALFRVNPPSFGHVGQMLQAQEVQVHKKPLDLLFRGFRLIRFKGADVKLGRINHLAVGLLEKVERELQQ